MCHNHGWMLQYQILLSASNIPSHGKDALAEDELGLWEFDYEFADRGRPPYWTMCLNMDVSGDGSVTSLDALMIVDERRRACDSFMALSNDQHPPCINRRAMQIRDMPPTF